MLSDILREDRRRISEYMALFIDSIKKGEISYPDFEKVRSALHNHIYWEESVLFGAIENLSNPARVHGLEVEHGGIWKLLDKIEEYLKSNENVLAIDRAEGLVRVLETHNEAEERTVYNELDSLPQEVQAKMILFEIEHARVPDDWICSVLSRRR